MGNLDCGPDIRITKWWVLSSILAYNYLDHNIIAEIFGEEIYNTQTSEWSEVEKEDKKMLWNIYIFIFIHKLAKLIENSL